MQSSYLVFNLNSVKLSCRRAVTFIILFEWDVCVRCVQLYSVHTPLYASTNKRLASRNESSHRILIKHVQMCPVKMYTRTLGLSAQFTYNVSLNNQVEINRVRFVSACGARVSRALRFIVKSLLFM